MRQLSGLCILLFCFQSLASGSGYQLHMRTGLLSGSFSGSEDITKGSFSLPTAIDIELELHETSQRSISFRSVLGMETDTAVMRYNYAGVGSRHYFMSRGRQTLQTSRGTKISIVPKFRHYVGLDAGISQVLIRSVGTALGAFSTVFELGASYGFIYQFSRDFGVQMQLGMGFGYGFSSVAVTATTNRFLLGATYYF